MDDVYSIGKTSEITGISIQMLRNYSTMGLVTPEIVDKYSGYRYYSNNQLHILDKIKYLRELDIPLSAIKELLSSKNTEYLSSLLERQRVLLEDKIKSAIESKELLDWYINFFNYPQTMSSVKLPYLREFGERKILAVKHIAGDSPATERNLALLRRTEDGKRMKFYRQFCHIIDPKMWRKGTYQSIYEFMFIKSMPDDLSEEYLKNIITLPAGKYMCFFDDRKLSRQKDLPDLLKSNAQLTLALEYSNNLIDYECDNWEYQTLIS